ncbi:MAG: sigma-54-dependent Fis family transcriptional regulator [Alphaproteobacteria bacterium]|nr:sigma-54-dependent Fis family transcriptional regulator [Alphaproteobacteria bacterium]
MTVLPRNPARILVVDDDDDILMAARLLLKLRFASVETHNNPARLPELVGSGRFDVVMLDMNFAIGAEGGEEGLRWLSEIKRIDPRIAVVLITAYADIATAVEAMKRGATDFIVKPWDNDRLIATLTGAAALNKARMGTGGAEPAAGTVRDDLIGTSPAMARVRELIRKAAPTDANVLLLGENGTGKELAARALHAHSPRAAKTFLSVDLGSVSAQLFESELFGHRKGAFTDAREDRIGRFQAASGGTLFLDEIGNLPLALQAKLLTAIERREVTPVGGNRPVAVDVRLICATNLTPAQLKDPSVFRTDLLYRINTVEIALPPLRGRGDDIPALAEHFVAIYARRYNMPLKPLTAAARARLKAYAWPGNVRALRHAVERAMIMSEGAALDEADFLLADEDDAPLPGLAEDDDRFNLSDLERKTIERALKKNAGNVSHAAAELGLTRASLYRRLQKYGL